MTVSQILKLKWCREYNKAIPDKLWDIRGAALRFLWERKPKDPVLALNNYMSAIGFACSHLTHPNETHYFENTTTGQVMSFQHKDL